VRRQQAFAILDGVWTEFVSGRYAVALLEKSALANPTLLPEKPYKILPSHLRACLRNLETTYTLRLFSEFEGNLRGYWAVRRPGKAQRRTLTEVLISRIGSILVVPGNIVAEVQAVREYRNQIIHHANVANPIALAEAVKRLNKYITYFPLQW
jgi:hypothetical protein